MSRRFEGKVALVTGASSGIGAATARQLAREGATVVLAARGASALEEVAGEIAAEGGRALAVPTDVADMAAVHRLLQRTVEACGGLHILVNNAGAHTRGRLEDVAPSDLAHMVQVNLTAPIVLTRMALLYFHRPGATVVNVASLAGCIPLAGDATYSATKFALRVFSFALADELRDQGIRVAVVSPGPVDTPFLMEHLDDVADVTFSQPVSTPEAIASQVCDAAADGRRERRIPAASGVLATLGYLAPTLRRALRPLMEMQGRRIKNRYLRRQAGWP